MAEQSQSMRVAWFAEYPGHKFTTSSTFHVSREVTKRYNGGRPDQVVSLGKPTYEDVTLTVDEEYPVYTALIDAMEGRVNSGSEVTLMAQLLDADGDPIDGTVHKYRALVNSVEHSQYDQNSNDPATITVITSIIKKL